MRPTMQRCHQQGSAGMPGFDANRFAPGVPARWRPTFREWQLRPRAEQFPVNGRN